MARYIWNGAPDKLYVVKITSTRLKEGPDPVRFEHHRVGHEGVGIYGPYAVKSRAKQEFNKHKRQYSGVRGDHNVVVSFLETDANWVEVTE